MAQQLRTLAAFAEYPGSIPSTHVSANNSFTLQFQGSDTLFRLLQALQNMGALYIQAIHTHTHKVKIIKYFSYFMYMNVLSACICAPVSCDAHAGQKRAYDSSRMRVRDGCQLPCWCWELNPGPLQEQPVLLTTEPSLHLSKIIKYF